MFLVGDGGVHYSILGLPFFSAFHIILDRTNFQITFQPGCDCESSSDGYPKILVDSLPTICLEPSKGRFAIKSAMFMYRNFNFDFK